jgi:RNA polymerase sigma-70 factor (ECF subfamily)
MSDEELLASFASTKDERYFDELHKRYRSDLITYVKRVNPRGDHATAEDIVQQTFLKVHLSHDMFDPEMKFRPWLYSIAANFTVNKKISAKRRRAISLTGLLPQSATNDARVFDPADTREDQPDEVASSSEEAIQLRGMVERLRPQQREVIERLYFRGMTSEQAAVDLGIPLGTVRSQLHRSLQSLRQWQGEDEKVSKAA